jgi:hypothetical protein
MYIHMLLLNIVTAEIEAFVLGNKICIPVSKKSAACERAQSHFDNFHQLHTHTLGPL